MVEKKRPHVIKTFIDGECDSVYVSQQAAKERVARQIQTTQPGAVILFRQLGTYLMYRDEDCIYVIEPYGKLYREEDNDG